MENEKDDLARMDSPTQLDQQATAGQHEPIRPENAYDLLEAVARHIEEEPRRYYQSSWVLRGDRIRALELAAPACGTVGCRAGWVVALNDGLNAPAIVSQLGALPAFDEPVRDRAEEILGLGHLDTDDLFSGCAIYVEDAGGCDITPPAGSPAYAKLGADGIRAFMKAHEAHLKARSLEGV